MLKKFFFNLILEFLIVVVFVLLIATFVTILERKSKVSRKLIKFLVSNWKALAISILLTIFFRVPVKFMFLKLDLLYLLPVFSGILAMVSFITIYNLKPIGSTFNFNIKRCIYVGIFALLVGVTLHYYRSSDFSFLELCNDLLLGTLGLFYSINVPIAMGGDFGNLSLYTLSSSGPAQEGSNTASSQASQGPGREGSASPAESSDSDEGVVRVDNHQYDIPWRDSFSCYDALPINPKTIPRFMPARFAFLFINPDKTPNQMRDLFFEQLAEHSRNYPHLAERNAILKRNFSFWYHRRVESAGWLNNNFYGELRIM